MLYALLILMLSGPSHSISTINTSLQFATAQDCETAKQSVDAILEAARKTGAEVDLYCIPLRAGSPR